MLDGLLRDLYLLAQRGKELQPTQILAQCTKTGPPTLQLARFGHGALLLRSGNASWPRPFPSAIGFIGVRFARFSAVLKVLLPCAKNWQLRRNCVKRTGHRPIKWRQDGARTWHQHSRLERAGAW